MDCPVRSRLFLLCNGSALRMLARGVAVACVALIAITVRVSGWMPVVEAPCPWIAAGACTFFATTPPYGCLRRALPRRVSLWLP